MAITTFHPSIKLMGLQAAVIVAVIASSFAMHLASVALLIWAVISPISAIQALSLCVVVKYLNPSLVSYNFFDSIFFLATPLAAGIRLLPMLRREDLVWTVPVWVFGLTALGLSILVSPAPIVSVMKAFTFAWIVTAILIAFMRLSDDEHYQIGRWLFSLVIVIAAASLVSLAAPAIAFIPTTPFLRGILRHSQALGCIVAPISAALVASWMLRDRWNYRHLIAPTAAVLIVILLTRSRTAAVAVLLSVAIAILLRRRDHASMSDADQTKRVALLSVAFCILAMMISLIGGPASSFISEFVFKRGETDVTEAFEASRGEGAMFHFHNFLTAPLTGHGFGVHADGVFPMGITEIGGVPVSAPVEKGFLPTAVLEETGIVGGLSFAAMIWVLVGYRRKNAFAPEYAMLLACLLVNLGEAVLLSPGGIGMFVWLLIGFCLRGRMFSTNPMRSPTWPYAIPERDAAPANLLR